MQIVYYYIEELNDIKQQNINFGDKYIFKYDPKSKELTADENELYIENFYGDNINITAIIGENGSGKTSLLNNLIQLNDLFFNTYKFIVITKINDIYTISYQGIDNVYLNENIKGFKTNRIIKENDYNSESNSGIISIDYSNVFNNTNLIYYNNILDFHTNSLNNDIINISTQHLLYNFSKIKSSDFEYNLAYNYSVKEDLKIIDFITSNEIIKSMVKIPEEINLSFNLISLLYLKKGYIKEFDHFFNFLKNNQNDIIIRAKVNQLVYLFCYFVDDNIEISSKAAGNVEGKLIPFTEKNIKLRNEFIKEIVNQINISINSIEPFKKIFNNKIIDIINNNVWHHNYTEDINNYLVLLDDVIDSTELNNPEFINLKISSNFIKKIIELSGRLTRNRPFITINYRSISSGEKSLLTMFSRLHHVFKSWSLNDENNLLIFIDEVDLYFHPDWQKQLISKLLEFLKIYFKNKKIHLIFTANNPLMISDILSYNTIFLQKIDNNTTIINNSLKDHKNTFAANIHTLLSDSFFMKNGTMGDFAKNKLNDIIEKLNHKKGEIPPEEREKIKKTIKLIGEPIIRKKLLNMYNEFYGDEIISRLEQLENRIKRLEDDTN